MPRSDGAKFVGTWENDKKHGEGVFHDPENGEFKEVYNNGELVEQ